MSRPGPATTVDVRALVGRSVEVIRENQDARGGYPAGPDYPPYRYCWFRDGAFIADAMSRAGEIESAEAFFAWCAGAVASREARVDGLVRRHRAGEEIAAEEHLHCRLRLDGGEMDEPWAIFQLDGYGAWLWALGEHARRHARSVTPFVSAAEATARYVAEFWNEPCFDWWEERWGRHTATLAAVHAGLSAASGWEELGDEAREEAEREAGEIERAVRADAFHDGRLGAGLGDGRLDASLVACSVPFGVFAPDDPVLVQTVRALEEELAHGGVHRHADDSYYGGGEWLLLAALLGWWYAAVGRTEDAWAQLEWTAAQATPEGGLPEQVSGHLLFPDAFEQWVERWGPPASPLLWSHAFFVTLAVELGASHE